MIKKIFESVLNVLFGEWNGIQIFLVPMTLFYLLDGFSVARWISGLLTHRIHYLPLTVFLFLFLYVGFVILKRMSFDIGTVMEPKRARFVYEFIIELHKQLIVLFFALVSIFMLSSFLKYFYAIHMPLRYILLYVTQVYCVMLIIYHYLIHSWLKHYYMSGYSRKRAWAGLLIYMRNDLKKFTLYSLGLILMIIFSVYLYRAIILIVAAPILDLMSNTIGIPLRFHIGQSYSSVGVLHNVWVLFVAFLTSNLLFAPIVKTLHGFMQRLHPLNREMAQKKQSRTYNTTFII